jgi:hypothetical protein
MLKNRKFNICNIDKKRIIAVTSTIIMLLAVTGVAAIGTGQFSYQQQSTTTSSSSSSFGSFIPRGFITSNHIADNTIISADLKDEQAVRSVDIVNGQVGTADLGTNAVTSTKIKNGEVEAEDLDPSLNIGGQFALQATERSKSVTFRLDDCDTSGTCAVSVQCNPDETVTGGGFVINPPFDFGGIDLSESKKQDNGWLLGLTLSSFPVDVEVYAECLKVVS